MKTVGTTWGEKTKVRTSNVNIAEYDDLFMKHKADIGRCKVAKHRIVLEPNVIPHREGARRMSPEKAEAANAEVNNLVSLRNDSAIIFALGEWHRHGEEKIR